MGSRVEGEKQDHGGEQNQEHIDLLLRGGGVTVGFCVHGGREGAELSIKEAYLSPGMTPGLGLDISLSFDRGVNLEIP